MNVGKVFEQQFTKNIPSHVLVYRLPDQAQSFNGGTALRFSIKNPFDYLFWNSKTRTLFAIEMKTVKGKSISFERNKSDNGEIHFHQIEGLRKWSKFDGIVCGLVIEFRELETTVFLDINNFDKLAKETTKKSFALADLDKFNIAYEVIPQSLAKTHYRYETENFLNKGESN